MSSALREIPPLLSKKDGFYVKHIKPYVMQRDVVVLLVPVIAYFAIFHYAPMYGIIIAFKDYRIRQGIMRSPWVGFEHFRMLFSGRSFPQVLRNTVVLSLWRLACGATLPIIFAILLNEMRRLPFRKVTQTISYLPHFLSWIVLAGMFQQFLSPSSGPVNGLIRALGFRPVYFLAEPGQFRGVLVWTGVWKDLGWGSIIYLAAISGVNPELYESAVVDGAGRFRQAISITLPSLAPVITIMFILSVGRLLNDNFDQVFNMYNTAVYSTGDVISTYTYRKGLIEMQYDFATAVGLFRNAIGFVLIIVTNAVTRQVSEYGIW